MFAITNPPGRVLMLHGETPAGEIVNTRPGVSPRAKTHGKDEKKNRGLSAVGGV
jgi:hypothetical protein